MLSFPRSRSSLLQSPHAVWVRTLSPGRPVPALSAGEPPKQGGVHPWTPNVLEEWLQTPVDWGALLGGEHPGEGRGGLQGLPRGATAGCPTATWDRTFCPPVALGTLPPSGRPCGPWTSHPRLPSEPTKRDLVSDLRPQRAWSPGQCRVWRKRPWHHPGTARGHCRGLLEASGLNITNRVHDRPAQDHDTLPAPSLADASLRLVPAGGHSSHPQEQVLSSVTSHEFPVPAPSSLNGGCARDGSSPSASPCPHKCNEAQTGRKCGV